MNIAIIGYGKMGKLISKIAESRGHQIVLKISSLNTEDLNAENLKHVDVAIEFSVPSSGYENVKTCLTAGVNTISGTTGWIEKLPELQKIATEQNCGFIYASNFSLGVNMFFALNQYLAKLMGKHPEYKPEIEEVHHTSKKDSPSGTAITLADQIIENTDYNSWINQRDSKDGELRIISKRIDPAPGTHNVIYSSPIDDISIQHIAHSREGFAMGAVIACEWINGRSGNFTMKDVLGL